MVIRQAQLQALEVTVMEAFKERLMEHARKYFPHVCARLDNGDLLQAVDAVVSSARRYGFAGQREICKFMNLQFVFGRHFDRDPECSWALPLLRGALPGVPRMERLYREAMRHEAKAKGYFARPGKTHERR